MSLLIIYDVYEIACAIAENKKKYIKNLLKMKIIRFIQIFQIQ